MNSAFSKKHSLLSVAFVALLAISSLLACQKDAPVDYPVFGKNSIGNVSTFETKAELLASWKESGLDKATLVLVDTNSGLSRVPETVVRDIGKMLNIDGAQQLTPSQPGAGYTDFLYTAVHSGMIKEVFWISPLRHFDDMITAEAELKTFLQKEGLALDKSDITNMTMKSGCLAGKAGKLKLNLCSYSTLPLIKSPVVLALDPSYFTVMADEYSVSKLKIIKSFFDSFVLRELKISRADITYGIGEGKTRPTHRYIVEDIKELLTKPEMLTAQRPPTLWALRDMADNMLVGGEIEGVVKRINRFMERYPDDSSMKLLRAEALLRMKHYDEALDAAIALCRDNDVYCSGLAYLGDMAETEEIAKPFYDALNVMGIEEFNPGMFKNLMPRRTLDVSLKTDPVKNKAASLPAGQ